MTVRPVVASDLGATLAMFVEVVTEGRWLGVESGFDIDTTTPGSPHADAPGTADRQ